MNAGTNVHVITEQKDEKKVIEYLKNVPWVVTTIVAHPDKGARVV